jgi:hypothetical protein
MVLPDWLAWTVHVPAFSKVMLDPLVPSAMQMAGVVVVKLTVNPDEDDALTFSGDCNMVLLASVPKLIV